MILSSLQNTGYQVQVIAPAGIAQSETLRKIKNALPNNFRFQPMDYHQWFFHSNPDEKRGAELVEALKGPCKVLFALKGGYGSARIFEQVAAVLPQLKTPKVLVGYSDITAVHLFLQKLGWPTIHGPILLEMFSGKKSARNKELLEEILSGRRKELSYAHVKPMNSAAKTLDSIAGKLIGGNLTLIQNSLGTPWEIDVQDRILFLEDVNVIPYHLDRELLHLKQAGLFQKAKALILGSFSPTSEEVVVTLKRFCQQLSLPVFQCDFIGHGTENYPLILNEVACLVKSENKTGAKESFFSFKQSCEAVRATLNLT